MNIHEMQRIVSDIKYKNWKFKLGTKGEVIYLQVRFKAPCADENNVAQLETQHGRKWMLSRHMTRSELVQTALKAVLTAEEHEIREQFTYCGEAVFGPHFDVDKLLKLSTQGQIDIRVDNGQAFEEGKNSSEVKEGVTKMKETDKRITDNRN